MWLPFLLKLCFFSLRICVLVFDINDSIHNLPEYSKISLSQWHFWRSQANPCDKLDDVYIFFCLTLNFCVLASKMYVPLYVNGAPYVELFKMSKCSTYSNMLNIWREIFQFFIWNMLNIWEHHWHSIDIQFRREYTKVFSTPKKYVHVIQLVTWICLGTSNMSLT